MIHVSLSAVYLFFSTLNPMVRKITFSSDLKLAFCRGHHFQTTPYLNKTGLYWELMITQQLCFRASCTRGYGNPRDWHITSETNNCLKLGYSIPNISLERKTPKHHTIHRVYLDLWYMYDMHIWYNFTIYRKIDYRHQKISLPPWSFCQEKC